LRLFCKHPRQSWNILMYFVQFNTPKVISYADPKAFERRAKRWLTIREGENIYLLGVLQDLISKGPQPNQVYFTVEEEKAILAAGILKNGILCTTWAPPEVFAVVAEHAVIERWVIEHVGAPAHIAYFVAKGYADRTGQQVRVGRGERIYQLSRNVYVLPQQGRLEVATPQDRSMVKEWVEGFIEEAGYEVGNRRVDDVVEALIAPRLLYLWKSPQPVSMAAWVSPTPNGASINFVYTPPEFRGQGYGKAVSAALAAQMLASGLKYCFILTDIGDERSNGVYRSIGARTLCEFLRCSVCPKEPPAQPAPAR
jgi:uncharacterized protein